MANEPLSCDAAIDRLQARLDGDAVPGGLPLQQHLRQCAECRSRFAAAEKLLGIYPTRLPRDFAATVAEAARHDRRHRRLRLFFGVSLSVAAVIVATVMLNRPRLPREAEVASIPSLETRLANATGAVRTWTARATQAIPELPPAPTVAIGPTLEPAATALGDARRGLAVGLSPLTSSFQRATERFRRDVPVN